MSLAPLPLPPAQALATRLRKVALCVGVGFLILVLRLWYLQILEGGYYFSLMTISRSTSGSGRFHMCRAASARTFTRVSLYL